MSGSELVNIASHLPEMARQQPERAAIIFPKGDRTLSFQELDQTSDRLARALIGHGISRGVRSVVMVPPSPELFALTFALFKVGAVPVLIDPGIGVKHLRECIAEAQPTGFIGIPKAHLARVIFGWGKDTLKNFVTVGRRLGWGGKTFGELLEGQTGGFPFPLAPTKADDVAAVLFTSGSTGCPKGAIYTHGNFAAQVETLKQVYGIKPGEIDLPTFPLFALFAPALGMTAVIPEMDFTRPGSVDPRRIIDAIQRYGATTMFGSPALINRVGRYGAQNDVRLPSLRRVICAGAPVPAAVLERFEAMLPAGEIFTPYGATEALPVCSIGSKEILGSTRGITEAGGGVCVGKAVDGVRLEVIEITDEPIAVWDDALRVPAGKIGEIVVQGAQVTKMYYNRPHANLLSKIVDLENGGFLHRMGDLGGIDDQGRVWFCGRKAHRVETPSGTLFTIPCEAVFNTHPKVFRTALVGIGDKGKQKPVLCVELEKGFKGDRGRIKDELLALARKHIHTHAIDTILFHPSFPVDIRHNAKIFREKLAAWAAGKVA